VKKGETIKNSYSQNVCPKQKRSSLSRNGVDKYTPSTTSINLYVFNTKRGEKRKEEKKSSIINFMGSHLSKTLNGLGRKRCWGSKTKNETIIRK